MLNSTRCVILNATYEPLSIVPAKRGLVLVLEGKAFVSEKHPTHVVHSVRETFPLPMQVVLYDYVKSRSALQAPSQLTQRNLFIRDGYTCQYCGRRKHDLRKTEFLTRDHIVPTVRGGEDKWNNVVAACNSCNNKKADYTLKEAEQLFAMKLLSKPRSPSVFDIWARQELKVEV